MNFELNPLEIFQDIDTQNTVLVAVSGGSDSIALLLLASAWAGHVGANLQVVTIDHGLRPEAAAEAAFVSGVSEALNLPHLTIAWEGMKPESGLSNASRTARYQLLEEFALDIGAKTILVGHTANDQAETILMRNARGAEGQQDRGLSGIAPLMILPQRTQLLRPLLGFSRNKLRKYLLEMNQSWIEDPSNMDEAYERVRIRNRLKDDEDQIFKICKLAELMGRLRKLASDEAAVILHDNVSIFQGPLYKFPYSAFENKPEPVKKLALQVLIAVAGGAEYFVSSHNVSKLLESESANRVTLGHCVIEKSETEFSFYREKRNLPSIVVGPGDCVLWDGRFVVDNTSAASYFCGAMSSQQLQELEQNKGSKLNIKPRAVLGGTPYLCGDGDDVILPFVNGFEMPAKLQLSLCVRSLEYFCPEYDFELLEFVDALKTRMASLGPVG